MYALGPRYFARLHLCKDLLAPKPGKGKALQRDESHASPDANR